MADAQKNHVQPLQALYFDSKGQLVRFYVNCYAGGFPQLHWNRNGAFENFLPKNQAPVDSLLSLRELAGFIKPISGNSELLLEKYFDHYVIVFWDKCMKRHSKRLIKTIRNNLKLAKDQKTLVLYVNYDNVAVLLYKDFGFNGLSLSSFVFQYSTYLFRSRQYALGF